MAAWVASHGALRTPDEAALRQSITLQEAAFARPPGDIEAVREGLFECMWDDVGILRTATGLKRAQARLAELDLELSLIGVADGERGYNLAWHDWLNLKNLIAVSRVIATAAAAREDSRGAHFREDFPGVGDLAGSAYTVVRQGARGIELTREAVRFNRVRPGETILDETAGSKAL